MKSAAPAAPRGRSADQSPAAPSKRRPLRWFIAAPARMALDPGLSHVAFRLATVLLHYEGDRGCFPSQQRLAEHLGVSLDSVQRYLRELELYGFLVRERRYRRTNRYMLEPLYEAPIAHGSLEATGALEIENDKPRRPPAPRTLRKAQSKPETVVAPVSPPPTSLENARRGRASSTATVLTTEEDAAPVRQLGDLDRNVEPQNQPILNTAPVRSSRSLTVGSNAALVRLGVAAPVRPDEPHGCGTIKTVYNQEPQHQLEASVMLDDGENGRRTALLALSAVGVNLVDREIGVHATSDIPLNDNELTLWAGWVARAPHAGVRNKAAFCAAKIRLGFSVADVFPKISQKRSVNEQHSSRACEVEREEKRELDAALRADKAIRDMKPEERQALRAMALDDGAVWLARDLSPEVLARVIRTAERTLALGHIRVATIRRDHSFYKALPPL